MQQADDEDDEDELFSEMTTTKGQTKLSFGKQGASTSKSKAKAPAKAKAAPKGKGKSKQIVIDSDDDDEESPRSSHTLQDNFDELDDDELVPSQRKPAAPKRAAARKPVQTVMLDDSDSDSDSGLTFKVRASPHLAARPTGFTSTPLSPFPRLAACGRAGEGKGGSGPIDSRVNADAALSAR